VEPSWLFLWLFLRIFSHYFPDRRERPSRQEASRSLWDHSRKTTAPTPFLPEAGAVVKTSAAGGKEMKIHERILSRPALWGILALAFWATGASGAETGAPPTLKNEEAVVKEQSEKPEKLPTLEVVGTAEPSATASVLKKDEVSLGP
jgi:hypothetical protein